MQVIEPMFAAYHVAGTSSNIFDPLQKGRCGPQRQQARLPERRGHWLRSWLRLGRPAADRYVYRGQQHRQAGTGDRA